MKKFSTTIVIQGLLATCLAVVPVVVSSSNGFAAMLDTIKFPRNKVASIYDSQGRAPMDCYKSSGTCGGTKTSTNELSVPAGGYFKVSAYPNPNYRVGYYICDASDTCTGYGNANIYAYKPGEYFLLRALSGDFRVKDYLLVFSLGSANPNLLPNGNVISWTFDSANLGEGTYFDAPKSVVASVTGTLRAGSTLTGSETYVGVDVEITRQWKISTYYRPLSNVGGDNISGATGNTYTLTNADVGKYIRYNVQLRNMQGRDSVFGASSDYALVLPALQPALTPEFGTYTPTASGFTVAITNYNTSYTWSGTATNGGSVSFSGTNGNGLATITGVSPNTASTATITTSRSDYNSGTATTTSTTSLRSGLTPTFGTYTRTETGFTVAITNYDSAYSWSGAATNGGSVAISGSTNNGLATITGLAANTSAVATISTSRTGYASGSANTSSTSALNAALNPTYGTYTRTSAGYTVQITNYSNQYNWSGTATNGASVSISNSGLVTVSDLAAGESSVATISTTRTGYAGGSSSTISTAALNEALTPSLGNYSPTANGFTVEITNYDPAYTWSGTATRGGSVSFSGTTNNGRATITGISPNTASTVTINTSRSGYRSGSVTSASTTSLGAALTPIVSSATSVFGGFTFNITNYNPAYNYSLSSTAGTATSGEPSGSDLPITVTGLSSGQSATVSITTTRSSYAPATSTRVARAKISALTPSSGTPGRWSAAAISNDGQYVVFAGSNSKLFVSPNYGTDWTAAATSRTWTSLAVSGNGQKMIAGANRSKLYLSTDYGVNWKSKSSTQNWRALAMSDNGYTIYGAVANGFIFRSTDGGSNWSQIATSQNWRSIATSTNGQVVLAATYGGTLYTSTDAGTTWTSRESARKWTAVSISDDGANMVATVSGGGIYFSADTGATWNPVAGIENKTWNSISCDSTCANFATVANSGNLYVLTPLGVKVADASNASKWSTVVLNSAGNQILAGAISGSIRRSLDVGANWSLRTTVAL